MATGSTIGTVSSMIEIESMIMPSANQTSTITLSAIQGSMPEPMKTPSMALAMPVIASLNGSSVGGWTEYARLIQGAGADALELNIYLVAADPTETAESLEARYRELFSLIQAELRRSGFENMVASGMVLTGSEVKSLREGNAQIAEGYARLTLAAIEGRKAEIPGILFDMGIKRTGEQELPAAVTAASTAGGYSLMRWPCDRIAPAATAWMVSSSSISLLRFEPTA